MTADSTSSNALAPRNPQLTIADVLNDVSNKDAAHRIGTFIDWMHAHHGAWLLPDLAAYRDYLLDQRGLAPASTAAHLSTIRGRYQSLLNSNAVRDAIYSHLPPDASPADKKAMLDEALKRLENAIAPAAASVRVVKQQDALDADHVRLTTEQALELLAAPVRDARNDRREAMRDAALIAIMLCTGLREMEVCALDVGDLRQRVSGQLGVAVRDGKGAKARYVPYGGLAWCLEYVDAWLNSAGIADGAVFRGFRRAKPNEPKPVRAARLSERAVQDILKRYPIHADGDVIAVAPHDLRRTYARLLHDAGVPVIAIQQNLGHASLDTTLRYIGDLHIEQRQPPGILRPDTHWLQRGAE